MFANDKVSEHVVSRRCHTFKAVCRAFPCAAEVRSPQTEQAMCKAVDLPVELSPTQWIPPVSRLVLLSNGPAKDAHRDQYALFIAIATTTFGIGFGALTEQERSMWMKFRIWHAICVVAHQERHTMMAIIGKRPLHLLEITAAKEPRPWTISESLERLKERSEYLERKQP